EEAEHTENKHEEPTIELEIEHDYKEYEFNKDLPNEQSDRQRIHQHVSSLLQAEPHTIRGDLAVQTGRFEFSIFDSFEFDNFDRNEVLLIHSSFNAALL
ncbi:hypothetical protein Tco_1126917, partial [Tanacetum coccineum]